MGAGEWNDPLSNAQGGMFSNMWNTAQNALTNNPEQIAIALGMLGDKIAPKNAMAGIGTHFGQSSLMNKARKEQQGVQNTFIENIIKNMSGNMTPEGERGLTKLEVVPSKDGGPETFKTTFNLSNKPLSGPINPTQPTQQPQQQQLNSMFGVSPF